MPAKDEKSHEVDLDKILMYLLHGRAKVPLTQQLTFEPADCYIVASVASSIFQAEDLCTRVDHNVNIVGDIHAQYDDLLRILRANGFPPHVRYLFLGDYVDRGIFSLETIMLLFIIKIKHPEHVILLRGNHETKSISSIYGFRDEIKERFKRSDEIWKTFCNAFSQMPVCAIVAGKIFCCHGGLSPVLLSDSVASGLQGLIDFINNRTRPYVAVMGTELFDMLWSDPEDPPKGNRSKMFKPGNRGCTFTFNDRAVRAFQKKFELKLIIRAHQVVKAGYKKFAKDKLMTIFSAPGYTGVQENLGAIVNVVIKGGGEGKDPTGIDMKLISVNISNKHFMEKDLWVKSRDIQNARFRASVRKVRQDAEREAMMNERKMVTDVSSKKF